MRKRRDPNSCQPLASDRALSVYTELLRKVHGLESSSGCASGGGQRGKEMSPALTQGDEEEEGRGGRGRPTDRGALPGPRPATRSRRRGASGAQPTRPRGRGAQGAEPGAGATHRSTPSPAAAAAPGATSPRRRGVAVAAAAAAGVWSSRRRRRRHKQHRPPRLSTTAPAAQAARPRARALPPLRAPSPALAGRARALASPPPAGAAVDAAGSSPPFARGARRAPRSRPRPLPRRRSVCSHAPPGPPGSGAARPTAPCACPPCSPASGAPGAAHPPARAQTALLPGPRPASAPLPGRRGHRGRAPSVPVRRDARAPLGSTAHLLWFPLRFNLSLALGFGVFIL